MKVDHGKSDARGARNHMEDRHTVVEDLLELRDGKNDSNTKWGFYGVFDGHGGDVCSTYVAANLHKNIIAEESFPEDIPAAMEASLRKTDEEFEKKHKKLLDDGSTVVFAIIQIVDDIPIKLWVANSGDSRSILIKCKDFEFSSKILSVDHKPGTASERERIEASGGIVKQGNVSNGFRTIFKDLFDRFIQFFGLRGPERVYDSKNRGGLAISRGAGDLLLKKDKLVIIDPDIVTYDVKPSSVGFVVRVFLTFLRLLLSISRWHRMDCMMSSGTMR